LFIRAEAVYGIRLINKYEEDLEKEARRNGASLPEIQIGHGPIIKIGVGWIFE
jgi:hypothetical protein